MAVAFQLVPILVAIQHELHIALSLGRLTATLDAALVAYGAYWREHGCSRSETRALLLELLATTGSRPSAARNGHELGAQDVYADIIAAALRPFEHDRWSPPMRGIVLAL